MFVEKEEDVGVCIECGLDYAFIIGEDPQRCEICDKDVTNTRTRKSAAEEEMKITLSVRIKRRAKRRASRKKNRG